MAKQLTDQILDYIDKHGKLNSLYLAEVFKENHQKIIGAIKSIEALGDLISTKQIIDKKWELTSEGQHVLNHGSHEAAIYNIIPNDGMLQSEIIQSIPFAKIGFSKALQAGWIVIDKSNGTPIVKKKATSIIDIIQNDLKDLTSLTDQLRNDYKKRKLIQEVIIKSIQVEKGPNFTTTIEKQETELTADLLINGAWKNKKFKPYNFAALGATLEVGHLHPLLKVRSEFRKIFLEMGFTEMPTNNYVESSFWNFDALFQPQQHPARDAHDTFFIAEPSHSTNFPIDYMEKVKKVHSEGDYGSLGYRYDWKLEEAQKNVLRTHTTAVSARMLYKLMQQNKFKPVKYFSIDRVFRNETLDATHLAEFHQIEGVIADYNLTLGDLIGILYEFFKKLGIIQLQFKPAYNPYTEPSMEIFCYHEGLKKWIEIGNSGMFRPEMLLPMGLPEDVNVIAWGLSLERPTMIKYGLNNIRDLVGPKVDLEMVYNNPICRLNKISHNFSQIKKLEDMKQEINKLEKESECTRKFEKQKLVLFCDPKHPIRFIEPFFHYIKSYVNIFVTSHVHSSVQHFPNELSDFCLEYKKGNQVNDIHLTIIWKEIGIDPIMQLPGMHKIIGEINIARYLNRVIENCYPHILRYESKGVLYANEIDNYLEKIHSFLHTNVHQAIHKKSLYIMGEDISIIDILLESFEKYKLCKQK
ncbi:phenylalanine--tRNA ligase alpha subunit isoform X1 [Apis cerana]|uniref:phenylalanine--tRNA ligase n=2 Tax=Apis cerana TaxID=7461 RepID=A0A2A3E4D1_APICC|nr:phenylalanine--tRNA ligase alpha subunit isoform X1 [Apis cerana]XP_061933835.1 phenylalanine--tRNA ligase alpha subunit isoform X1 [Apis cerana]XP_061933836.1 phenylalanine--tRNA ligase alpha subunit isoform X1 [Apis cerana]XP_061933837.1 phenylalanine--tRNA ligase alpha subunit isoform X1 [Apis cerana]XP_061933838.1 phenylalanine--tRNA ligase alpha subunit isoform X1 [Apis cerana]XP_061933839.1 phenylalanine--tRNA ligase alpha subunit isoform X1 [Apis cerana]XP_061933840.1 phenylalanine-